jgi:hypothetical protein
MGMTLQLHQLDAAYARMVADNPDEVLEYVDYALDGRLPETAQGEELNIDKAWHGLHYLLTGTAWAGFEPAYYLVKGGEQVGDEQEHDVGYGPARILFPQQVAAFNEAVQLLTPDEIERRFSSEKMVELQIYPEVWSREGNNAQDNIDYLNGYAQELQAFLSRAAKQQKAVICYLC